MTNRLDKAKELYNKLSDDFKAKNFIYETLVNNIFQRLFDGENEVEIIEFLLREILKGQEINSMLIKHTTSFNIEFTKKEIERINEKYKKPE